MKNLIITTLATTALVAGSVAVGAAANEDSGTVVRVIDGDTLIASINNGDHTIRLLNVDTPETKDPNQPVECLGPQATEYLDDRLPKGTKIRLEFDVDRHDKYGKTLAGVFAPDGSLVNAEIAREGLGIPVQYGKNVKFLPPVQAAYEEAGTEKTGLFSEGIDCTLPAQLAQTTATLDAAAAAAPASTSAAAGAAAALLVTDLAAAKSLRAVYAATKDANRAIYWAGLSAVATAAALKKIYSAEMKQTQIRSLHTSLMAAEKKAEEERRAAQAHAAAKKKAAKERAAAEVKAAKQLAAAEKKAAEERAVAEKKAAEEAARQAAIEAERLRRLPAPAPYVPPAPQPYVPPAPAPYVPPAPSNYTGPRCYAPGGKTWRPC
jgi:micrococcal nuclease